MLQLSQSESVLEAAPHWRLRLTQGAARPFNVWLIRQSRHLAGSISWSIMPRRIHILGPILTAEESMWDKTFEVNVKGYWRMVKACVPSMRIRGGGKIINMASVAGKEPQQGLGSTAPAKPPLLC